jgi:hypothetical protein
MSDWVTAYRCFHIKYEVQILYVLNQLINPFILDLIVDNTDGY